MINFALLFFVIILSRYLWSNWHFFNFDVHRNFSDNDVPHLKNGFSFAIMSDADFFTMGRVNAKAFGKSYRSQLFNTVRYMIIKAKDAEKILTSTTHLEKSNSYRLLGPFLKTGLLTSFGEKWFQRRRILTPAFHFSILKDYFEIFKEEGESLVKTLSEKGENVVDVVPISSKFTLNSVCESAMGVKLSKIGNDGVIYRNNILELIQTFLNRVKKPWLRIDFIHNLLGYGKELESILEPIHKFTKAIIRKRREEFLQNMAKSKNFEYDKDENIYMSKKKRYAMMDTLLQAQSEGLIDDEGIIEETDTFTFEGHDTTAVGMTFSLLILAHHQDVQQKMFEEIDEFIGDENDFSMDVFNKMPYMDRVLKECLRLYPPVPVIGRQLAEEFTSDGVTYPKGTDTFIFQYDIHRDPEVYPDPEKFDPDRFLPEQCNRRSPFAYIPFSAGMRNCIGQKFATLELKVMLAKVTRKFKVLPVTKREELTFIADLVLRTNHPVKMKFIERK